MRRTTVVPLLSPAAEAMVLQLVRHLDNDPNAGAYLILSRQTADRPQIDTTWDNIAADGIVTGLMWACNDVLVMLRKCPCGRDHAVIIAALERVITLLAGNAEAMQ